MPTQILILNLLSDFPMLAIATDNVSSSEIRQPMSYHIKNILIICVLLGTVSTIFDLLFFIFFKYSAPVLQTNWFIGSVLTELALIFSVRTQSSVITAYRPSLWLIILSLATACITILLPYTKLGQLGLHFIQPKFIHLVFISLLVILYFVTT
jgi:Mg2+-importing ATPase